MIDNYDAIDEILFQAVDNMKQKEYSNDKIEEIIYKSKLKKMKKNKLISRVAIIISFLFISAFSIMGFSLYKYNENNNIIANNNKTELEENVIEYYYDDNVGTGASFAQLSSKELFEMVNYVAIVKIEDGLEAINYDKEHGPHYNGEYRYTYVRTVGRMTVIKSVKGDLDIGDTVEFRKKGGKILYSEYLKYFEENKSAKINEKIQEEYQELINKGINDVYVNLKSGNSIDIEEGKEYLVYVTKKSWGDLWLESGLNAIREYNPDNNKVLNNYSGEWEDLENVLM